jgi:small conductance mechanosensitive channel
VLRRRNRNNPTIVSATETYLAVVLAAVAVFAGLVAAGQADALVNTDSALLVAALTFAFGVAGQEVLGSLVSGVFLISDPDFNVGDWISWPGGEGTVEAIDFRVTRIRTPDNETLTVPNTELTTNTLTRPFGREQYRVTERAFVSYAEDTERALMELQAVATDLEDVAEEPAPNARIVDLGPDSVVVQAEFWVADPQRTDVATVRSDYRRRVKRRFDEAGLTLAPAAGRDLSGTVTVESEDYSPVEES